MSPDPERVKRTRVLVSADQAEIEDARVRRATDEEESWLNAHTGWVVLEMRLSRRQPRIGHCGVDGSGNTVQHR